MFIRIRQRQKEKGNILFFILLAVILFAALSYAVTQSIRGGGKDASVDKASAQASDLLGYYSQLDTAIQRMMVVNNIDDYELNFFKSADRVVASLYDNSNCTTSNCRVFDPAGGAVTGRWFPDYSPGTSGAHRILLINIPGAGTSKADLVISLYKAKPEICKEINNRAGLGDYIRSATLSEAPTLLYYYSAVSGPYADTTYTLNVPEAAGRVGTFCACSGTTASTCEENTGSFYPAIYHVLVAR